MTRNSSSLTLPKESNGRNLNIVIKVSSVFVGLLSLYLVTELHYLPLDQLLPYLRKPNVLSSFAIGSGTIAMID